MAKKSFPPKLNSDEAVALQYAPREWSEWSRLDFKSINERLANRGLLDRKNGTVSQHWIVSYRLSRRGELMLTRWQRQQADVKWRTQQALRDAEVA